jgi:hypothetical protein
VEAALTFAAVAAALVASLAFGVALARAGLAGLFRLMPVRAAGRFFFASDVLRGSPLGLAPQPEERPNGRQP